jgi:predicted Zn finger-like uncharacterized protein
MKLQIDITIRCPYCQQAMFFKINEEDALPKGHFLVECIKCRKTFKMDYKVRVKPLGKNER